MKKVLTFCLALLVSTSMWAVEIVKDSLKYDLRIESDRYAVLRSCLKKEGGTVKVEAYLTYENQIYPVREISAFAFMNSKVSRVYLSYNTQTIHNKAFANSKLEILYLEAETPPAIEPTAFKGIDLSQCRLYVPDACIEAYRSADVWKDFGHVGPASLEPVKYVNREWTEWLEQHLWKGCITESRRIADARNLREMVPKDSKRIFLPEGFYFVSGDLDIHKYGIVTEDKKAVHLILCDGAQLTVNWLSGGLDGDLHIHGEESESGRLDAVNTSSDNDTIRAGIGSQGRIGQTGAHIYIHGGIINAQGRDNAAGIGGGLSEEYFRKAHSDIDWYDYETFDTEPMPRGLQILGGRVTARGGDNAPGIGNSKAFSSIEVSYGGFGKATIFRHTPFDIFIYGGMVEAIGGKNAAGIGAAVEGNYMAPIVIHGGIVTARGGKNAAGIGRAKGETLEAGFGKIEINGGTVYAYGGKGAPGIGLNALAGYHGPSSSGDPMDLEINGGEVNARGGDGGAGIGGREMIIYIKGGEVYAYGYPENTESSWESSGGAGIGGDEGCPGQRVTINGGTIYAYGSKYAAGIGGGQNGSGGPIHITGGIINAFGGTNGAGIGSGEEGYFCKGLHSDDITIEGGTVNAYSYGPESWNQKVKGSGAGIGGGKDADLQKLVIKGGTVNAYAAEGYCSMGSMHQDDHGSSHMQFADQIAVKAIKDGKPYVNTMRYWLTEDNAVTTYVCDHANAYYTISGREEEDIHTMTCPNCLITKAEKHSFADHVCRVCGVLDYLLLASYVNYHVFNRTTNNYELARTDTIVGAKNFSLRDGLRRVPFMQFSGWYYNDNKKPATHTGVTDHLYWEGQTFKAEENNYDLYAIYRSLLFAIENDEDNTDSLNHYNGLQVENVTLKNRTFTRDGTWNTVCLPFDFEYKADDEYPVAVENLDLASATVMELQTTSLDSLSGTLRMAFAAVARDSEKGYPILKAGRPYIIRWAKPDDYENRANEYNFFEPVFRNVTIKNVDDDVETDEVIFKGYFSPCFVGGGDESVRSLSAQNTMDVPAEDLSYGACRGHFELKTFTLGSTDDDVFWLNAIELDFGQETGIETITVAPHEQGAKYLLNNRIYIRHNGLLYDASGRKVSEPTK